MLPSHGLFSCLQHQTWTTCCIGPGPVCSSLFYVRRNGQERGLEEGGVSVPGASALNLACIGLSEYMWKPCAGMLWRARVLNVALEGSNGSRSSRLWTGSGLT
jgi:hypothetical protein